LTWINAANGLASHDALATIGVPTPGRRMSPWQHPVDMAKAAPVAKFVLTPTVPKTALVQKKVIEVKAA
jgi:hypothetical protein